MSYEFQELRFDEGQLYTTLLGRPESVAATTLDLDAEQVDLPLISEIVKRFNAHLQLVELLKDRQETRILHKREARKAKYQQLVSN